MNSKRLGEEIAFIRKKKNLSQKELADGICTQAAISQIEAGSTFPRIDTLYYLSIKLRVDIAHFLSLAIRARRIYL